LSILALAAAALLSVNAQASPDDRPDVDGCIATMRARALQTNNRPADIIRTEIEVGAAKCVDPGLSDTAAAAIGAVNADLARVASAFLSNTLGLGAYRALRADRIHKLALIQADSELQQELATGDADGDFVPDRIDQCPGSPNDRPTDDRGCPVRVATDDGTAREESDLRGVLRRALVLVNHNCVGSPAPATPTALEWGHGTQRRLGSAGFNVAVTRVSNVPAGCEVFYEIQFRFSEPRAIGMQPIKFQTVVFAQSENLVAERFRAVFPLPVGPPPLTPGRAEVIKNLTDYGQVLWRVRAATGSNMVSDWSSFSDEGHVANGVDG
jgi:hypothetical protein